MDCCKWFMVPMNKVRTLFDAEVDLIAFTGSKTVGQSIMQSASRQLKRIILELGGKDPDGS